MRRFFTDRVPLMATLAIICMAASATASRADDASLVDSTVQAASPQIARLESRLDNLEAALQKTHQAAPDEPFLKSIAPIISSFAGLLAVVVAVTALIWQRRARNTERELSRRFKATDVATWCIDRFYDIHEPHKVKDDMYYNRLWGLHYAQFNHYKNGLLDRKLYETWLDYLRIAYNKDEAVHKENWHRVKAEHINDKTFSEFIESILKSNDSDGVSAILAGVPQTQMASMLSPASSTR